MKTLLNYLSTIYVFISSLFFLPIMLFLDNFSKNQQINHFHLVVSGIVSIILVGTFFTNTIRLFSRQPQIPEESPKH